MPSSGETFGEAIHVAWHKTEDPPRLPPSRDASPATRP
jgi:hypothetical protein